MADMISKEKRSQVMAAVKCKGNKDTELKLIMVFRANGITGWRRHQKLPGNPDFAFCRERLLVFVDGCFWHRCKFHCRMPQTNEYYWQTKIARNVKRDKKVTKLLQKAGWRVIRIWEHSLKNPIRVAKRIKSGLNASGL